MRYVLGALCMIAATSTAFAQKEQPFKWELDAIGKFEPQGVPNKNTDATDYFKALEILSGDEVLVEGTRSFPRSAVGSPGKPLKISPARAVVIHQPFIVKGIPTKGVADGSIVKLDGVYKVTSTKKHDGRTYFVISPFIEPKPIEKKLNAEEEAKLKAERDAAEIAGAEARRKAEAASAELLATADKPILQGRYSEAKAILEDVVKRYPETKAGKESAIRLSRPPFKIK